MNPFVTRIAKRRLFAALETIEHGILQVTTPEGERLTFGSGGPVADIEVHDWSILPAFEARGDIAVGETYIAGLWDSSDIEVFLTLVLRNLGALGRYAEAGPLAKMRYKLIERLTRDNSLKGAARNIRKHYDVGNEFYQLWLDPSMTYSSALYQPGDDDLERAQQRKYDRILERLSPGERVLEIGCGWGGFAERAAEHGRQVTGITISPSQKAFADARLDGRAEIRLQDYRKSAGRFDNIVSIEMIEAVGERYWPTYFAMLKARLADGGRAVIQAITIPDAEFSLYRKGTDFIRQHVFPGGMLPCNAVLSGQAARAGLTVRAPFSFGQDYARTCNSWNQRLQAQAPRARSLGFGEPFLRGWRFYLQTCAATFGTGRTDVVQMEFFNEG